MEMGKMGALNALMKQVPGMLKAMGVRLGISEVGAGEPKRKAVLDFVAAASLPSSNLFAIEIDIKGTKLRCLGIAPGDEPKKDLTRTGAGLSLAEIS